MCPLPQYNFTGSFVYILPDSANINLPSIAFSVPDLDAYAQVTLTDQADGSEALCLATTLSNGKSTYLNQVQWALGGLAIGAFIIAAIHTFWPLTPYKNGPEWRFATIIWYLQHVALCGFISADFPSVYRNFTLNFAWAQGLIYVRAINDSINRMRLRTGGVDVAGLTYAVTPDGRPPSGSVIATGRSLLAANPLQAISTVPYVQNQTSYTITTGIDSATANLGITYANAFVNVLILFLILCAVMVAVVLLALGGTLLYSLIKRRRAGEQNMRYFALSLLFRTAAIGYMPIVLFSFWQFTHRSDSGWAAVLLAALTFIAIHALAGIAYWRISRNIRKARDESVQQDHVGHHEKRFLRSHSHASHSLRWTTVDGQYQRHGQRHYFMLAAAAFVSAAFVAFGQGHALLQIIPLIIVEVTLFVAFVVWRPYTARGSTVLMCFISLFKAVAYGLLIAFWSGIAMDGIVKAVLGFVIVAVQGIMVLVLFIETLYNLGAGIIWAKGGRHLAEAETGNTLCSRDVSAHGAHMANPGMVEERYGADYTDTDQRPVSSLYMPNSPEPLLAAPQRHSDGTMLADHSARNSSYYDPRSSSGDTIVAEPTSLSEGHKPSPLNNYIDGHRSQDTTYREW